MTLKRIAPLALAAAFAGGCAPLILDAERLEVQQGDLLSRDDIAVLEPGQTRDRVRELIGAPSLSSPFRNNRWDYVYYRTPGGMEVEEMQRLTLHFDEQGRLAEIEDRYQPPDDPIPDADAKPVPKVDTHGPAIDTSGGGTGPGQPRQSR